MGWRWQEWESGRKKILSSGVVAVEEEGGLRSGRCCEG